MDIPFARKVLEFVEIEHDDFVFDMSTWIAYKNRWIIKRQRERDAQGRFISGELKVNKCGTAACLAGTAVLLDPNPPCELHEGEYAYGVEERAIKLLGISVDQAADLFYLSSERQAIAKLRSMIEKAEEKEAEAL